MGGAFVAVAADSTATWWNPAGLATGPYSDVSVGTGRRRIFKESLPARRDRVSWFAATAPAVGFSYYRLRITDIRGFGPTGQPSVDREDTRAEVSVRSISVNAVGPYGRSVGSPWGTRRSHIEIRARNGARRRRRRDRVRRTNCSIAAKRSGRRRCGEPLRPRRRCDRLRPARCVVGAVMRNIREPEFGDGAFDAAAADTGWRGDRCREGRWPAVDPCD